MFGKRRKAEDSQPDPEVEFREAVKREVEQFTNERGHGHIDCLIIHLLHPEPEIGDYGNYIGYADGYIKNYLQEVPSEDLRSEVQRDPKYIAALGLLKDALMQRHTRFTQKVLKRVADEPDQIKKLIESLKG